MYCLIIFIYFWNNVPCTLLGSHVLQVTYTRGYHVSTTEYAVSNMTFFNISHRHPSTQFWPWKPTITSYTRLAHRLLRGCNCCLLGTWELSSIATLMNLLAWLGHQMSGCDTLSTTIEREWCHPKLSLPFFIFFRGWVVYRRMLPSEKIMDSEITSRTPLAKG